MMVMIAILAVAMLGIGLASLAGSGPPTKRPTQPIAERGNELSTAGIGYAAAVAAGALSLIALALVTRTRCRG